MAKLNAANNAQSPLNGVITDVATSMSVLDGSIFPDAPFAVTVEDEIIYVVEKSGSTFSSILRAQEGTAAAAHAPGVSVENRWTAGMYNALATQEEVDEHKAEDAIHFTKASLTKSDVGLSNVDNVKQMPISGGVLENYREKLVTLSGTSTTINLSLGNVFTHSLTGNTTYSITNAISGQAHSFTLIINMGSTVRTLTFPASVKWQGGEIPDMTTASKTYVLTFMTIDGGTNWLGMFGGEF